MSEQKHPERLKTELLPIKEAKQLDPYKEDEFYTIRKQVDLMRAAGKLLNKKDELYYKIGDLILLVGAVITLFMSDDVNRFFVAGGLIATLVIFNVLPFRRRYHSFKKLKRVLLSKAAVGDVVHGPYTITLSSTAEKELYYQGMTSAVQTLRPKVSDEEWRELKTLSMEELDAKELDYDEDVKPDDYLIMVVRNYDETDYSQVINVSNL